MCDPRKNARQGNKNDRIDARELSDRLYMYKLSSVYHREAGVRTVRELARSYLTISKDLARVMTRVKAMYRSWGIPCAGKQVYGAEIGIFAANYWEKEKSKDWLAEEPVMSEILSGPSTGNITGKTPLAREFFAYNCAELSVPAEVIRNATY